MSSRLPPVEHHRVDVGGVSLHYAEIPSQGRPMVMLHGIGMDWRVWQAISRRLAPHFHVHLVDLRGHGESDKPAAGYLLGNYAADVEDLIDVLALEDAVLVGSSLGGMVAASTEIPSDIVRHRVLVDPPLTGGPVRDARMLEDILHLKHRPVSELIDYLAAYNPGAGRFLLRTMSEMWHEAADGVIQEPLAHRDDYFAIDSALEADDARTLLMQADPARGGVLTNDQAGRALSILPHGELAFVPGAGHAIHAEKPREFVDLILRFTRDQPRNASGYNGPIDAKR